MERKEHILASLCGWSVPFDRPGPLGASVTDLPRYPSFGAAGQVFQGCEKLVQRERTMRMYGVPTVPKKNSSQQYVVMGNRPFSPKVGNVALKVRSIADTNIRIHTYAYARSTEYMLTLFGHSRTMIGRTCAAATDSTRRARQTCKGVRIIDRIL